MNRQECRPNNYTPPILGDAFLNCAPIDFCLLRTSSNLWALQALFSNGHYCRFFGFEYILCALSKALVALLTLAFSLCFFYKSARCRNNLAIMERTRFEKSTSSSTASPWFLCYLSRPCPVLCIGAALLETKGSFNCFPPPFCNRLSSFFRID